MLAGPAKLRLPLTAVRIAIAADTAVRRVSTGIAIAMLMGIDIQATHTTVQIGRVLCTIAFSKGIL